jgi:hypothetical protein
MTALLQATYLAKGMNRSDLSARQQDDSAVKSSVDNLSVEARSSEDSVLALVEEQLGISE